MSSRTSPEVLIPSRDLTQRPLATRRVAAASASRRAAAVELQGLWARLRRDVDGEIRFDEGSRGLYAQDASNYLHVPLGVVVPRSAPRSWMRMKLRSRRWSPSTRA